MAVVHWDSAGVLRERRHRQRPHHFDSVSTRVLLPWGRYRPHPLPRWDLLFPTWSGALTQFPRCFALYCVRTEVSTQFVTNCYPCAIFLPPSLSSIVSKGRAMEHHRCVAQSPHSEFAYSRPRAHHGKSVNLGRTSRLEAQAPPIATAPSARQGRTPPFGTPFLLHSLIEEVLVASLRISSPTPAHTWLSPADKCFPLVVGATRPCAATRRSAARSSPALPERTCSKTTTSRRKTTCAPLAHPGPTQTVPTCARAFLGPPARRRSGRSSRPPRETASASRCPPAAARRRS